MADQVKVASVGPAEAFAVVVVVGAVAARRAPEALQALARQTPLLRS